MAVSGSTARRYAEAVLDIATAEGAVEGYRASLERLASGFDTRTLRLLGDPSVPLRRRVAAAGEAVAGEPGPVQGLVRLLLEDERIALLPRVAASFGELVDQRAGVAKAVVTTAVEIERDARERMVGQLARATGKTIEATFRVDPAILGGAMVRVDDRLVDASLRTRLEAMRRELAS